MRISQDINKVDAHAVFIKIEPQTINLLCEVFVSFVTLISTSVGVKMITRHFSDLKIDALVIDALPRLLTL